MTRDRRAGIATSRLPERAAILCTVLLAALLIAGCAGGPHRAPEIVRQPVPVSPARWDRVVATAMAEWERWGSKTALLPLNGPACLLMPDMGCLEIDDGCGDEQTAPLCPRVHTYWAAAPPGRSRHACGLTDQCAVSWPTSDSRTPEDTRPWSAVFISHVMKVSGFSETEFWPSISHAGYIVPARKLHTTAYEVLPAPARAGAGDIICATRADTRLAPHQLDLMDDGVNSPPLHCEIVVAVNEQANTLFSIGGNVQQTVARSEVTLDANGRIEHVPGAARPWILVMRARRDTRVACPEAARSSPEPGPRFVGH